MNLIKGIPQNSNNKCIRRLGQLKEGVNKGVVLAVICLCPVTQKGDIPISFIVADSEGGLGVLSVFNTDNSAYDQFRENCDVLVSEPVLKSIRFQGWQYKCIQVFELNRLMVDKASMENKFTPNVIVTQTFEK